MNRKRKFNRKYLLIILILVLLISFCLNLTNNKNLIDDYYTYINKDILDKEEIADGEIGWSRFTKAQDKVDEEVELIVKDLINNKTNSDINVLYNNIKNINTRNSMGLGVLNRYINLIDSSKNINEFINNAIIIENELYIDIFTLSTVAPDFKDTSKAIVYFYPISFDFGMSGEMYINPDYDRYHALLKQYQIKLLKLYGYDKTKAREVSKKLDNLFVDISKKSLSEEELSDVDNLYNVMSKDDLQKIYTNLDINSYLEKMGISNQTYFSVVDVENYKAMNSYLKEENLALLKEYVKVKILEYYSGYTSMEYQNTVSELNDKLMGISSEDDLEEYAINTISSVFSNEVDKIYLEKNFNEEDRLVIENIAKDILSYYENNINNNTWMDTNTKEKALLKLKNMKINIGGNYLDSYSYNLKSFENGSSLVENMILISKVESDKQLEILNNNSYKNIISPTIVNAYYSPLDNSINFPASLKEIYNSNDDYYSILGSMGMIIAHEITHAFDNSGSKFDEVGNRTDWWSESDYKEFENLQKDIIDYYSRYEVFGINVDGKKTVGENIADLGAMNAIVEVAKKKGASDEEFKKMFSSYASLWASEYIDSYQKLLLLSDTHSPDKVRVNAVLSSCDTFYEVYDISKKDLMYIDKNNRVGIW